MFKKMLSNPQMCTAQLSFHGSYMCMNQKNGEESYLPIVKVVYVASTKPWPGYGIYYEEGLKSCLKSGVGRYALISAREADFSYNQSETLAIPEL